MWVSFFASTQAYPSPTGLQKGNNSGRPHFEMCGCPFFSARLGGECLLLLVTTEIRSAECAGHGVRKLSGHKMQRFDERVTQNFAGKPPGRGANAAQAFGRIV